MQNKSNTAKTILGFVTGGVAFGLLFVAWVYPEIPTASYTLAAVLAVLLGVLAWLNQRSLKEAVKTRSLRYGTNALITVALVVAILITLNFLNANHFVRKDLTKDKIHSLSDQTTKVLKNLQQDVKLTVWIKTAERDAAKGLLSRYLYETKKLSVDYVDPDRDPARAKAANVKKYGTLVVSSGKHETRIEEMTEEKLTNAIIKVLKDKPTTVCFLTGHGERSLDPSDPDGYSQMKTEFASQNYESKQFNLLEEAKVPAECTVLLILGPNRSFFEKEMDVLKKWLDDGGRAFVAVDPNLKGADRSVEIKKLLSEWFVDVGHDLVLDPTSQLLGVNASVPVVGTYNKDHVITREFQATSLFPMASSIELRTGAPSTLKSWWLAKSTPRAFSKTDFREIATGKVTLDPKKDKAGPHIVMAAVEGLRTAPAAAADKENPETRKKARIVVMGTSQVASNRYASYASNLDLFLNSVSWLADDETLISIRPKEEGASVPTLSKTDSNAIQLLTLIVIPVGMLILGFIVWIRRRKL